MPADAPLVWGRKACLPVETVRKIYDGEIPVSRPSGDCICEQCGKKFYAHCYIWEHEWIVLLCDGTFAHL